MTRKQKRLSVIGGGGVFLALAAFFVLTALNQQITFFVDPSDLIAGKAHAGQRVRLGGLVEEGSVQRGGRTDVHFRITDTAQSVPVRYNGILPDLFSEGESVVTEGMLGQDGVFIADTVLAKHDETYMPREVADSLERKGIRLETD